MVEDGLIIVSNRGVTKTAYQSYGRQHRARYAGNLDIQVCSVMFTQYGRELSPGGMNEAGLVVESMGLFRNIPNKKFPDPDEQGFDTVIGYAGEPIHNFATVKEVIESDTFLRIRPKKGVHPHFIISDKEGNCATIEFLDGKMVCHTKYTLPYRALTNTTEPSIPQLSGKRQEIPEPDTYRSIERFSRRRQKWSRATIRKLRNDLSIMLFQILKSVSWSIDREVAVYWYTSNTRWSIVYDQKKLAYPFSDP